MCSLFRACRQNRLTHVMSSLVHACKLARLQKGLRGTGSQRPQPGLTAQHVSRIKSWRIKSWRIRANKKNSLSSLDFGALVVTRLTTLTRLLALSLLSVSALPRNKEKTAPAPPSDANSGNDATALTKSCRIRSGSLQLSIPKQHQLQLRSSQGDAGHPERPAGDFDPHQRRLEHHHADDLAAGLAAVAAAGANRAVRHWPDHVFGVPVAKQASQRLAMGDRAGSPRFRPSATGASAQTSGAAVRLALWFMKGPWVAARWSITSGHSVARRSADTRYNTFLTQPFVNYNLGGAGMSEPPHHHSELAHRRQQCLDTASRRRVAVS